ncbi:putative DEAD-box ATP-dependent RNA helicase 37-like isoform 1 [Capsicum annuum]|uniref:uncharacterized protein LOC107845877 isoform X1 n=1 Tax=Capsicum annuum TaxID=4072 RepID=UPI001FB13B27|nr:uncharacterized protein LOC107845877 isoform X1 [Capsicum annuum]XP_047250344.1 uncharacterized protein LOC107845877 isoform X1 [Capsicum annuum]KAF3663106.1 putative DEAD-box ATP-dependent RNA helicase 37-like isoform 1 [Capsicum annuum]
MRDNGNISEYRDKLDQTLSSHDLVNDDLLKNLVKNQMLRSSECGLQECSDNLVERRTKEMANFLSMLRSTSVTDSEKAKSSEAACGVWKIKQDTEDYRVMYREGPEGTPFHTLLVEGYVDGPSDVCLCISWGAEFYNKWWPQTTIPTFKVAASECVQKIREGEQICLVRMKLSWPLSTREALVHFFVFEYLQDGLIVVLLNSISDVDSVDRSTHGYSKDGIPLPQDVVRIDVVGGFAIQKVTDNRSYFRTIANMDIKLDFIPPSLINFISRQLVGAGFKLYKKEVASVTKGDQDFSNVLKDTLYARIRKALYSDNIPNGDATLEQKKDVCHLDKEKRNGKEARVILDEGTRDDSGSSGLQKDFKKDASLQLDERKSDDNGTLELLDMIRDVYVHPDQVTRTNVEDKSPEKKVHFDNGLISSSEQDNVVVKDNKVHSEIEEINEDTTESTVSLDKNDMKLRDSPANQLVNVPANNKKVVISSEVRQALGTLEKAISIIRDFEHNLEIRSVSGNTTVKSLGVEEDGRKDSKSSETDRIHGSVVARAESPEKELSEATLNEQRTSSASHSSRRTSFSLCTREANHIKKVAPASPGDAPHAAARTSVDQSKEDNVASVHADTVPGKKNGKRKRKLPFYCCLYFQDKSRVDKE